jgi:hypothetical protein
VADPVVVTGPIHSSSSTTSVASVCWVSLVHVLAPPPVTEVAVMVPDDTLTASTSTSPTWAGDTARVVMPVLWALVSLPTAVMPLAASAEATNPTPVRRIVAARKTALAR